MEKAKLIIVRHGSTAYNSDDTGAEPERIKGWMDLPLTEKGVQESIDTGKKLAKGPVSGLYSSDLQRALHAASIFSEMSPNKPQVQPSIALRPWNVGKWAGQPVDDIFPQMNEYANKKPTSAPPEGEPWQAFMDRWIPALQSLMEKAKQSRGEGSVVAVTHSRNLEALSSWLRGGMHGADGAPVKFGDKSDPGTGDGVVLEHDGRTWRRRPL